METTPSPKANHTSPKTRHATRRLGRHVVLCLLLAALLAATFGVAGARSADARIQRPAPGRSVTTAQVMRPPNAPPPAPDRPTSPTPPPAQTPAPRPADDRTQLAPDALQFVAATALPAQPEFAHLFGNDVRHLFAEAPTYLEPVRVAGSELQIERTIDYELEPGVCKSVSNQRTLGDLCFVVDPSEDITGETAAYLADVRRMLAQGGEEEEELPGITAAQALRLSDVDLLELILNSGPRSITRSSVMPITADGSLIELDPADPVVAGAFGNSGFATQFEAPGGVFTDGSGAPAPFDFDTEYFLTGHTIYRSYSDKWSYEKDAWWHPRIYVAFSYSLNAGFGVRAPFSIDVDYVSDTADGSVVAVSVDPVSLDVAAGPVGLPSGAYFGGKEFVLELNFDCKLEASVAGLGGSVDCDDIYSIDTSFSRDFDPVIGSETRNIHNWFLWEDGKSPIRQELLGGAIYGEINLGIGADVVDGEASVRITSGGGTTISGVADGGRTIFDDRSATHVTVEGGSVTSGQSFTVSDPEYHFDVAVRPKVKFTAGIDTSIYENSWSFVAPLDFLGFSVGFGLDHHDGTVESHHYQLASGLVNDTHHVGDEVLVATQDIGSGDSNGSGTSAGSSGVDAGSVIVGRPDVVFGTAILATPGG